MLSGSGTSSCSRIYEGPSVNVDVTSAGATVALGLMYLKTNNTAVADRLSVPPTLFLLDYVRPDLLMLRQMCMGLVMWDGVEPSLDWVRKQVPVTLRQATGVEVKQPQDSTGDTGDGGSSSHSTATGTTTATSPPVIGKVDRLGYAQAHANIITGALLSMGMRYAGTRHAPAHATLSYHVTRFHAMLMGGSSPSRFVTGVHDSITVPPTMFPVGTKPDRTTLEMCLGAAATSLGMVMAGSGELSTLRLFRTLRLRPVGTADGKDDGSSAMNSEGKKDAGGGLHHVSDPGKYTTYGHHQAIASAMGLLFLGGGRATLSRDNESIAALVLAFFPRYPNSTVDNRYHLQALRHLYVLAVDYRILDAIDVDTGNSCLVPMSIRYRQDEHGNQVNQTTTTTTQNSHNSHSSSSSNNNNRQRIITPCLLPESSRILDIVVESPRHFFVHVEGEYCRTQLENHGMKYRKQGLQLFVKRRSGCLPYSEDPYGQRSLAARRKNIQRSSTHHSVMLDPDLV